MYLNKTGQLKQYELNFAFNTHVPLMQDSMSLIQDSVINNIHFIILLTKPKFDSNYFWYQQQVKTSIF